MTRTKVEQVMEVYSFEEILEENDVTPEEALAFLVDNGFIKLPEVQPVG